MNLASIGRVQLNAQKRYWVLASIAAVLLVLLAQTLRKAYRVDGYDLTSYLLSAQALLEGNNPYAVDTPFPYIYPLFLAFAIVPLTILPYWFANIVWFVLSFACLLVSCALLIRAASGEIKVRLGWHLAIPGLLIFLVVFSPIQNNLLNGQVNLVVLACCVMFFHYFIRNKTVVSAAWLAAAIALKLLPAVLLAFLLFRRRLWLSSLTVAFTILFCLLPGLLVGEKLVEYYTIYLNSFLLGGVAALGGGEATGFNLQSVLAHFLPWAGQNVWVRLLSLFVSGLLLLLVDLAVIRSSSPGPHAWGFCAYLIGSLLLSPMGETHHLVFAIPAIVLIGMKVVFDGHWMTMGSKSLIACFVVSFTTLPKVCDAKPLYFVALAFLMILLLFAARESKHQPVTPPFPP